MLALPSHFVQPKFDSEAQQARFSTVPIWTQKDTAWCINIWKHWREARNSTVLEKVPSVICMVSPQQLQHYLSCFVLEARKKDGTEYHPDTLYHIVCDVIQFLRENGQPEVEFFKVHIYDDFRSTLDSRMKRLKQAGMGSCKCQAEPLTEEEEEVL